MCTHARMGVAGERQRSLLVLYFCSLEVRLLLGTPVWSGPILQFLLVASLFPSSQNLPCYAVCHSVLCHHGAELSVSPSSVEALRFILSTLRNRVSGPATQPMAELRPRAKTKERRGMLSPHVSQLFFPPSRVLSVCRFSSQDPDSHQTA